MAELLGGAGEDVVILYGERLTHGARGDHAARALLNVAGRVVRPGHEGSGLLELPAGANGRGLREAGVLPNAGPGLAPVSPAGLDSAAIGAAGAAGALSALYLLHVDPLRDLPSRRIWRAALQRAGAVVAHADFLSEGLWTYATVVFPAESYAEKEGTVTHPDGRVQRLRPAIARPDAVRAEWNVIADLSARLGHDPGVLSGPMASARLFDAVPFYAGLSLDELGGRGARWPARPASAAWPSADTGPFGLEAPLHPPTPNGALRLGTFRSIWASPAVELSPSLKFLRQHQRAELSPADAQRLGVAHGAPVTVGADGSRVSATAVLRSGVPVGTVFLEDGIPQDSASELDGGLVEVVPE
jgi:NADH-quinone oxidoreductase subunit G